MSKDFWNTVLAVFGLARYREPEQLTEVRMIHASDGVRRLRVYSRANGAFCFREDFYDERTAEARWEPAGEDYLGEFESPEAALEEAARTVPWVAKEIRN